MSLVTRCEVTKLLMKMIGVTLMSYMTGVPGIKYCNLFIKLPDLMY
jgi:hypothetical protein